MLVVTSDEIPGKKIVEVYGLVKGNTIRARHIGRDIMAALRNIVGGEVTDYTKMIAESREQALDRMIGEAMKLGANAIVALRFGIRYSGESGRRVAMKGRSLRDLPLNRQE